MRRYSASWGEIFVVWILMVTAPMWLMMILGIIYLFLSAVMFVVELLGVLLLPIFILFLLLLIIYLAKEYDEKSQE